MDASAQHVRQSRHKWFPMLVLSAAAIWWWRRASYAHYHTLLHVLVLLLSTLSFAVWFLIFGGAPRRVRRTIIGVFVVVVATFFITFRPVFNGDMGVYRWRLRFARSADESLEAIRAEQGATDWQRTPHDYPRFLGDGYWAEVKGVELVADWHSH